MLLWLEDDSAEIADIKTKLLNSGVLNRDNIFKHPIDLMERLVELKMANKLNEVELLLDIYIRGCVEVFMPEEWCGVETTFPTANNIGLNAGVVFYDRIVKAKNMLNPGENFVWNPLPTVVFLTGVNIGTDDMQHHLQYIKKEKENRENESLQKNRVYLMKKSEFDLDILRSYLKEK